MNFVTMLYKVPHKTLLGIGVASVGTAAWLGGFIDDKQFDTALLVAGTVGGVGIAHKLDKIKGSVASALAGLLVGAALLVSSTPAMADDLATCGGGECGVYFLSFEWPPAVNVGDPTGFVKTHVGVGAQGATAGAKVSWLGGLCRIPKVDTSPFCGGATAGDAPE